MHECVNAMLLGWIMFADGANGHRSCTFFFASFLNLLGPVSAPCGMLRFRVTARKWNNFAGLSRCSPQRAHRVKVTAHHEFVKVSFFGSLFFLDIEKIQSGFEEAHAQKHKIVRKKSQA